MNDSEDTTDNPGQQRPLGYWLVTLDELLTEQLDAALDVEGATRREWMILNALADEADAPGFLARLERHPDRLHALFERGWVEQADGEWRLSEAGAKRHKRLAETVAAFRERVAGAVPEEDFRTTLRSLETIARELGWDETRAAREEDSHDPGHRAHGHGTSGPGAFGPTGFGPTGFSGDAHERMHAPHGHGPRGFGRRGFGRGLGRRRALSEAIATRRCEHAPAPDGYACMEDAGPAWRLRRERAARLRFARRRFEV